ncbi:uncharacterized protein LOC135954137 [Calliphora vicina]|uniref:uncharacterized protein LOC135954137 n=1 Tax=Calliphora vicina TaxID=7373 RepID=UPI00325B70A6
MIFIENLKLFAICVLCLNMYTQVSSTTITQIGDVRIEKSNGIWLCDRIECPPDADRCFVSKSNEVDPSILKRVNYCYSRDNQILKQHVSETPVDPNSKIKMQMTSTRNGGIITSNDGYIGSLEDFDEEKFNRQMNKMKTNLKHMNENVNKNLKHQMHNLHENLNKMKNKMAHMFDD